MFSHPGLKVGDDEVVWRAGNGLLLLCGGVVGADAKSKAGLSGLRVWSVVAKGVGDCCGEADGAKVDLAPEAHRVALAG